MRASVLILATAALLSACAAPEKPRAYHTVQKVCLPGDGGWDLVSVDKAYRRVFIPHTTQVDVLDADSGKPVGIIDHLKGTHGVAIAEEAGRGFITDGKANRVVIFDMKSLAVTGSLKSGKNPDTITYDRSTGRVFAFNAGSGSTTAIDAAKGKYIRTINLGGKPEFAVSDGEGHVFVNLEDQNEVLKIDAKALKVLERWSTVPGDSPTSLAIDRQNHRLFIGCRNRQLIVMNAENGLILAGVPIGEGVDATAFDAGLKRVISSNSDGSLTVIRQDDADRYHVEDTVITKRRSRTFGLDEKTHRLFVPGADFSIDPEKARAHPQLRLHPQVDPGSFKVFILAP